MIAQLVIPSTCSGSNNIDFLVNMENTRGIAAQADQCPPAYTSYMIIEEHVEMLEMLEMLEIDVLELAPRASAPWRA